MQYHYFFTLYNQHIEVVYHQSRTILKCVLSSYPILLGLSFKMDIAFQKIYTPSLPGSNAVSSLLALDSLVH